MVNNYYFIFKFFKNQNFREFLIIFRKIIFIDLQIPNIKIEQKAHFLLFFTMFWSYFSSKNKPFIDEKLNKIDNYSNLSSCVILFCGCLYLFDVNSFMKPLLYFTIILINAIFLAIFAKNCIFIVFILAAKKKAGFGSKIPNFCQNLLFSFEKIKFTIWIPYYFREIYRDFKKTKKRIKSNFNIEQQPLSFNRNKTLD